MTPIDLDHNATTPPSDAVVAAVADALRQTPHNPSSVHRAGQLARRVVERARQDLADLIHAKPRDLVFTSCGTESIDLALRGVLAALPPARRVLATSRLEHAAVRDLAESLERADPASVLWLPIAPGGTIDVDAVAPLLAARPADRPVGLASVQWANNETGAIQPLARLTELFHAAGAVVHCDATQWIGKMPADVSAAPDPADPGSPGFAGDLLTFAPHKFHGPKGVGVLWIRPRTRLRPQLLGTQELGRRGGTENVPGIAGAGVAAREAADFLADPTRRSRQRERLDRFEAAVRANVPDVVVNAPADPSRRLWNTINLGFPKLEAEPLLMLLSERGVWASAGAACSSGSLEPSPVLLAMGVPPEVAHGSIRVSIGRDTTDADLDAAASILAECVARLRRSSSTVV